MNFDMNREREAFEQWVRSVGDINLRRRERSGAYVAEQVEIAWRKWQKDSGMIKSKYLAVFSNKCGIKDSLGIDYSWCGNGRGGQPNLELQFDTTTGKLVGAVFMPEGTRWSDEHNKKESGMTKRGRFNEIVTAHRKHEGRKVLELTKDMDAGELCELIDYCIDDLDDIEAGVDIGKALLRNKCK